MSLYKRFSRDDVENHITKVAFIGSYLPRRCGIATFTHDLRNAVAETFPDVKCIVIAMNDIKTGYAYPPEVTFEIEEQERASYLRAADYINTSGVSLVCVQHEFGIYGGPSGSLLLTLLRALKVPVIFTLHTILQEPNDDQRRVMRAILTMGSGVVTMAEVGRQMLRDVYFADESKIHLIPHGIPEMEFANTSEYKQMLQIPPNRPVILTFGLLSPNKGIEFGIRAMQKITQAFPNAIYIILGQTHPSLIREHGDSYRYSLQHLAKELGIENSIAWVNEFADLPVLKKYIAAADVYLTPYLHEQQITSGTLSYAYGMGSAVVSTPYWHARELLAEGRGTLVPFRNADAIAEAIIALLSDDSRRLAIKTAAYEHGRTMTWSNTARRYFDALESGCEWFASSDRQTAEPTHDIALPALKLDHLHRLIDRTGVYRYATFSVPDMLHGYSTDEAARALQLLAVYKSGHQNPWSHELEMHVTTLGAYLNAAFRIQERKFFSAMKFDRTGFDGRKDDATQGKCLFALGTCVRFGLLLEFCGNLFREALPGLFTIDTTSALADGLLGVQEYLTRYPGDHACIDARKRLVEKISAAFKVPTVTAEWHWYSDDVSCGAASIAHALIMGGAASGNPEALHIGLRSLRFVWSVVFRHNVVVPLDYAPWSRHSGAIDSRPDTHQQPSDAAALVAASLAALRITDDHNWMLCARAGFEWFMGRNTIGLPLYDSSTAGCMDGIHDGRANNNQSSEPLLAMLSSLLSLHMYLQARAEDEGSLPRHKKTNSF